MGFFKKSLSVESKRTALTIIAKGNKISGEMSVTGKLHIDGYVEGCITSIENVSVGRTGEVKGRIQAKNVTVSGLIKGEVFCDHLHISPGGRVVAKVECCELTMDAKSQFIGERQPLKLPDFQQAATLHDQVKETSVEKPEQPKENVAHQLTSPQDFIDDLPDKITLAPIDTSDLEAIEAEISLLDKKAEKAESVEKTAEVTDKKPISKSQTKRTILERRADKRREIEQGLDRRKLSRRETIKEVQQGSTDNAAQNKNTKSVEQLSRAKVADENTTKLELKF